MDNIVTANFEPGSSKAHVNGIDQWDRGIILRISGLDLPTVAEIQFSLREHGGESVTSFGTTTDGVTEVAVPPFILETSSVIDYTAYAFIYLNSAEYGKTVKKIAMRISARPKPIGYACPVPESELKKVLDAVNAVSAGDIVLTDDGEGNVTVQTTTGKTVILVDDGEGNVTMEV